MDDMFEKHSKCYLIVFKIEEVEWLLAMLRGETLSKFQLEQLTIRVNAFASTKLAMIPDPKED
tara:strand:- start:52 stop:240 length:189 start_codon:yes stop_codon:yes gene_type:complete